MKKNKIIGLGVAIMGVAVSVGSAFALYQKGFGTENGIGFGGFHYQPSSGAYTFMSTLGTANPYEVESGNPALNPTNKTVKYAFKIAASYGTESAGLIKQDAILGKLSIEKTGTLANYITMSAYVDGYAQKQGEQGMVDTYWSSSNSLGVRTLGGEGNTISAHIPSPTSSTASITDAISQGKFLTVHVTLTLNDLSDEQFMALDEAQYSLAVRYDDIDATYGRPYIVGDGTNWTVEDEYAMVPNLAADAYEFCFKGLNSDSKHTFSQLKVLKNKVAKDTSDIWNPEKWLAIGSKADSSQNVEIDATKQYFVTFKGDDRGGFVVNNNDIYQE